MSPTAPSAASSCQLLGVKKAALDKAGLCGVEVAHAQQGDVGVARQVKGAADIALVAQYLGIGGAIGHGWGGEVKHLATQFLRQPASQGAAVQLTHGKRHDPMAGATWTCARKPGRMAAIVS